MKISAGILLYRVTDNLLSVFLVHPGGPFFTKKNKGWWTIPKGEPEAGEELLACAIREFAEETGYTPAAPYTALQPVIQKGGKKVYAWAAVGNLDAAAITCNEFEIEWPPKSGIMKRFSEVDKAGWFSVEDAYLLINERQRAFLQELVSVIPPIK